MDVNRCSRWSRLRRIDARVHIVSSAHSSDNPLVAMAGADMPTWSADMASQAACLPLPNPVEQEAEQYR